MEFDRTHEPRRILAEVKSEIDHFLCLLEGYSNEKNLSELQNFALPYATSLKDLISKLEQATGCGDIQVCCQLSRHLRVRIALLILLGADECQRDYQKALEAIGNTIRKFPDNTKDWLYLENIKVRLNSLEFLTTLDDIPADDQSRRFSMHLLEQTAKLVSGLKSFLARPLSA